jgi:hypothetical protein
VEVHVESGALHFDLWLIEFIGDEINDAPNEVGDHHSNDYQTHNVVDV